MNRRTQGSWAVPPFAAGGSGEPDRIGGGPRRIPLPGEKPPPAPDPWDTTDSIPHPGSSLLPRPDNLPTGEAWERVDTVGNSFVRPEDRVYPYAEGEAGEPWERTDYFGSAKNPEGDFWQAFLALLFEPSTTETDPYASEDPEPEGKVVKKTVTKDDSGNEHHEKVTSNGDGTYHAEYWGTDESGKEYSSSGDRNTVDRVPLEPHSGSKDSEPAPKEAKTQPKEQRSPAIRDAYEDKQPSQTPKQNTSPSGGGGKPPGTSSPSRPPGKKRPGQKPAPSDAPIGPSGPGVSLPPKPTPTATEEVPKVPTVPPSGGPRVVIPKQTLNIKPPSDGTIIIVPPGLTGLDNGRFRPKIPRLPKTEDQKAKEEAARALEDLNKARLLTPETEKLLIEAIRKAGEEEKREFEESPVLYFVWLGLSLLPLPVGKVGGVVGKWLAAAAKKLRTQGHHMLPRAIFGDNPAVKDIATKLHRKFHDMLNKALEKRFGDVDGFTSYYDWEFAFEAREVKVQDVIDLLVEVYTEFDKQNGTQLKDAFVYAVKVLREAGWIVPGGGKL